jgi:hypothetical protein
MHPLGYLPLQGREGVTLIASSNCEKISSAGISCNKKNLILHLCRIVDFPVQQDAIIDAT